VLDFYAHEGLPVAWLMTRCWRKR